MFSKSQQTFLMKIAHYFKCTYWWISIVRIQNNICVCIGNTFVELINIYEDSFCIYREKDLKFCMSAGHHKEHVHHPCGHKRAGLPGDLNRTDPGLGFDSSVMKSTQNQAATRHESLLVFRMGGFISTTRQFTWHSQAIWCM